MSSNHAPPSSPTGVLWVRRLWRSAAALCLLGSLVVTLVLLDGVATWVQHRPLVAALADSVPERTAYMALRAASGVPPQHRRWVPLDSLPTAVVCAVVSAEDANFFRSGAVDWRRQRELLGRMLHGDFSRGASGITQQLARNLYLGPARTPRRKMREYLLAFQLDQALPKERQLELYVNLAEWGDGVWGIASGSERLFGKAPRELTPTEAVLLPMVLPAPSRGLAFPLGVRQRRARGEGLAKALWRQAIFDDLTWTATAARVRRLGEQVEAGLTPVEAVDSVAEEMGVERSTAEEEAWAPWPDRCDYTRRGVL